MSIIEYEPFHTDVILPKEAVVYGIYDDWEGFRILLKSLDYSESKGIIRISFGAGVYAYREIDEGDQLTTPYSNFLISIAKNSDYLKWFEQESRGVRSNQNLKHYSIQTCGPCIDIIDSEPPKIEWL